MEEFLNSIANYVLTGLTALAVWFFKQLQSKESKEEAKEMEAQLRGEIKDLRAIVTKQQEFIYNNVATKKDLEDLKIYFKDYFEMIKKELYTRETRDKSNN